MKKLISDRFYVLAGQIDVADVTSTGIKKAAYPLGYAARSVDTD